MNQITFEELPRAVTQLTIDVNEIKRLLLENSNRHQPEPDKLLTVAQCAEFLSLTVPTIYGLIHSRKLPFIKRTKRVYFLKNDLINFFKERRHKTANEISEEAEKFLNGKK